MLKALKKLTSDHKDKISKALAGKNRPPRSLEWMKKLSDVAKKRVAEKNANWRGGTSSESSKKWKDKNMEKVLLINRRYRLRKSEADGSHAEDEWQVLKIQYNWTCPACNKKEPLIKLGRDHIIPLSRGGSNNIENIQPLCGSCNSKKRTKIKKYV